LIQLGIAFSPAQCLLVNVNIAIVFNMLNNDEETDKVSSAKFKRKCIVETVHHCSPHNRVSFNSLRFDSVPIISRCSRRLKTHELIPSIGCVRCQQHTACQNWLSPVTY